jgi:uncharacterized membrane protein
MNIHPIVVHFPIALLTLYSIFEIARFPFLTKQPWYFFIKAVLVILGSLVSGAALLTGQLSEKFQEGNPVLEYHEFFAYSTAAIFGLIALLYALTWYADHRAQQGVSLQSRLVRFSQFIVKGKLIILLVLLGLMCVTITGGLGGVMVFGPDADPFFKPIYQLLMKIKL